MHVGGSDGSGVSGTDRAVSSAVGVLGLLVCATPLVLMAFVYRARMPLRGRRIAPRVLPARSATVLSSDKTTGPLKADDACVPAKSPIVATFSHEALDRRHWLETVLTFFTHRKTQWQAPPAATSTVAASALVFLLKPCAYPHSWQIFVDVGAGLLQGALNGVASFPFLSCDGVAAASWTLFVVCLALVLYAVVLRGRNTNGEVVTQVLMFSLTSAAMLAAALGDQDSSNVVSLVQAALELLGCVPVLSVWKACQRWCSQSQKALAVVSSPNSTRAPLQLVEQQVGRGLAQAPQVIEVDMRRKPGAMESDDFVALEELLGYTVRNESPAVSPKPLSAFEQRLNLRELIRRICDERVSCF